MIEMFLGSILLLLILLAFKKKPTKRKLTCFRVLAAIFVVMYCVLILGDVFSLQMFQEQNDTKAKVSLSLVGTDESGVFSNTASMTEITVDATSTENNNQSDDSADAKAASLASYTRNQLKNRVLGLLITIAIIVIFRKTYHASPIYTLKPKKEKKRKEKVGNKWRIPVFFLGIIGGLVLGVYDTTGAFGNRNGIGLHRAVYYVLAIALLVFFIKMLNRFDLINPKRQPLRTRLLDGCLIVVFCCSVVLSASNLANQYSISKKVEEQRLHEQGIEHQRQMNAEAYIKTQLNYPDGATFDWDDKGVTVQAPNAFGVYSTIRYDWNGN